MMSLFQLKQKINSLERDLINNGIDSRDAYVFYFFGQDKSPVEEIYLEEDNVILD